MDKRRRSDSAFWRWAGSVGLATPNDTEPLSHRQVRRLKRLAGALLLVWLVFGGVVLLLQGVSMLVLVAACGIVAALLGLRSLNRA